MKSTILALLVRCLPMSGTVAFSGQPKHWDIEDEECEHEVAPSHDGKSYRENSPGHGHRHHHGGFYRGNYACQQACASDLARDAWYGYVTENEVSDGVFVTSFVCLNMRNHKITLRPDLPVEPPNQLFATYYGIRGLC